MLDKIKNILAEYADINENITEETNLINDLELSSLDLVNIIVAFEDEFNIEIPDRKISEIITVGDIICLLKEEFGIE